MNENPCTRFHEIGANAATEEHMQHCDDCLENKRIARALGALYATATSDPGWEDAVLAQIDEEEARRRSVGSGVRALQDEVHHRSPAEQTEVRPRVRAG